MTRMIVTVDKAGGFEASKTAEWFKEAQARNAEHNCGDEGKLLEI